ncbi:hypothetical protein [Streptomyces sp. AK02-04a]|uniref:hypothetical protein n=1 Tax=Streptomyces sp. AK02-04a TaxID=3028649 RepID=UPI0029BE48C6|nr:hypothetical protein [Streptomyces sp. AK02-04a]MDX3760021.1 hypothetical protein [Streptomyces sp. AK02-04a]
MDDPSPEAWVELTLLPLRPTSGPDAEFFAEPLRITPADLLRLHLESGIALGEIRAEARQAEIEYRRRLGRWYEDGRAAAASREPEVSLLVRVLEGLRRQVLTSV